MALCFRHCKKLNVVGAGFRSSALWIILSCQCGLNWFDIDMEQIAYQCATMLRYFSFFHWNQIHKSGKTSTDIIVEVLRRSLFRRSIETRSIYSDFWSIMTFNLLWLSIYYYYMAENDLLLNTNDTTRVNKTDNFLVNN